MHVTPNLNFDGLWTQREQKTIHQSRLRLIVKGIVKGVTGRAWSEKKIYVYLARFFRSVFFKHHIEHMAHLSGKCRGANMSVKSSLCIVPIECENAFLEASY